MQFVQWIALNLREIVFRHKPTLGGITFSTLPSVSLIEVDISRQFKADFESEMDLNVNSRGKDTIN